MSAWIAAARMKTLSAGVIPVLVGSALALREQQFHFWVFLACLIGAVSIQIATNYINDAADFVRGADTEERLGPPRMAQTGALTPKALYWGAAVFFLLAAVVGAYLILFAGLPILWIGICSIVFAIAYTAGPFPLAYLGLGDFFVFLFFGLVAVCGSYYAHARELHQLIWWLAVFVGLHGMSLIIVNNTRDIPTDAKVGKKTVSVRIGYEISKKYYSLSMGLPFLGVIVLYSLGGFSMYILLPLACLPMLYVNLSRMRFARSGKDFNDLLTATAKLQIVFGVLLAIAVVLA